MEFLNWVESTPPALAVAESLMLTASLSAAHAVGFMLLMSAAVVVNLNRAGLLLRPQAAIEIRRAAGWVLGAGLTISVVTGLLQFAPRASYTAPSGVFQLKMSLLLVAVIYQFTIDRLVGTGAVSNARWISVAGTVGALIWLSLALTACWFILFE